MRNPFTRSGITAIETEIANLDGRRKTLVERREKAAALLEASRSARKNALATDPAADLSALTAAVRDAEDEVATLDGVLHDLGEQRQDAEGRLEAAKDADVRKAAAKELDGIATQFDSAAAELGQAIDALTKAAGKMAATLPSTLHVVDFEKALPKGQSDAERIVATIVAEGLSAAMPSLMPVTYWGAPHGVGHVAFLGRQFDLQTEKIWSFGKNEDFEMAPLSTVAAARAVVTDRLRSRAERIVAGEASPDLADREPWVEPEVEKSIPLVEVFVLDHFKFKLEGHHTPTPCRKAWATNVPEDVADAAVAAGVALRTDTEKGAKAFEAEKAKRQGYQRQSTFMPVSITECVDLGVIRSRATGQEAA